MVYDEDAGGKFVAWYCPADECGWHTLDRKFQALSADAAQRDHDAADLGINACRAAVVPLVRGDSR
jgi:hypothetical protein